MPVTRGCFGRVEVGGNPVAELRTWEINESSERIDASAMGDCTRKFENGPVETTGTFTCWLDDTDTTGQGALGIAADVTLVFMPAGTGSGLPQRTAQATVEAVAERAAVDGLVERDYTYFVNGAVDRTPQT